MTGPALIGVAFAVAAAVAFECSYVLQALEARGTARVERPELKLLVRLARRRRWLLAIALSVVAFGLQVLALQRAPLSLVQPILALGLLVLIVLARLVLHERIRPRDAVAAVALIAGVALLVLAAPAREGAANATGLAVACVALGAVLLSVFVRALGPVHLIVAATAGDALAALAINEVARALPDRTVTAIAWTALAAGAGLLALSAETSALQRTAATVVAPVVLAGQVAIPVGLAPLVVGESWAQTPGGGALIGLGLAVVLVAVLLLARSPAVEFAQRPG